jgi:cytochrome c
MSRKAILRIFSAAMVFIAAPRMVLAQGEANGGNADSGKAIFAGRCGACHYVVKDRGEALGVNLDGFFGKPAGSDPTYQTQYSSALKNSGLTWDAATLDKWLAGPAALIPGTRMAGFKGLSSETQRADVIAYLSTLTPAN